MLLAVCCGEIHDSLRPFSDLSGTHLGFLRLSQADLLPLWAFGGPSRGYLSPFRFRSGARGFLFCGFSEAFLVSGLFPTFCPRSELLRPAQCATGGTEQASDAFNSGAGFSVYSPMPSYQKKAVAHYFTDTSGLPDSTLYNRLGNLGYAWTPGFILGQPGVHGPP